MSAETRRFGYKSVTVPAIPEIVAHRGACAGAPENTLPSINLGWRVGADAVEIDIHLTSDGRVVVHHCPTTGRTCGGVDLKISESTFDELRALNAGSAWGDKFAGAQIPAFEEVLALIPEGKRMLVEIKCHCEIIPEFLRLLDASGKDEYQVAVISFNQDVIAGIKEVRPSLQAYWLCTPTQTSYDELIETAKSIHADGFDAMIHEAFNEEFVRKVREAGMALHVWTVDDDEGAARMAALKVDGITTNRPAEVRALLEGRR